MEWHKPWTLCFCLTILTTILCSNSNPLRLSSVVYHVKPLGTASCSNQGVDVHCATLLEYARNNETYFNASRYENITMKFLSGEHKLRLNFTVSSDLKQLILKGTEEYYGDSDNVVRVLCESEEQFVLHGIEYIMLQGFAFASCGGLFVVARDTSVGEYQQLLVFDSVFENSKAGAVIVRDISLAIFKRTKFINNTASKQQFGGACTIQRVSNSVQFHNCLFQDNSCTEKGGAIFADRSRQVIINNSNFVNNSALLNGGAITLWEHIRSEMYGTTVFENNFSAHGGGVYVGNHCKLNLQGSHTFIGNHAKVKGGAIHVRLGQLIGKRITLTLRQNKADIGGGLFSFFSPILLQGKVFIRNNCANNDGGGVYIAENSIAFNGVTVFDNNRAIHGFGGGIRVQGYESPSALNISGQLALFSNNWALKHHSNGGAIYVTKIDMLHTYPNLLMNIVSFSCKKAIFSGNRAGRNGGGLFLSDTKFEMSSDSELHSQNDSAEVGGWMFLEKSVAHLSTVHVNNNLALEGGAIAVVTSTLNFQANARSTFTNNTARHGGALFIKESSLYFYSLSLIIFQNNRGDNGGALYLTYNSFTYIASLRTAKLQFIHNSAVLGGAIFIDDRRSQHACKEINAKCPLDVFTVSYSANSYMCNFFFENNYAHQGSLLYGGLFDRCRTFILKSVGLDLFKSISRVHQDPGNESHSLISSGPVQICFCKDMLPNCSMESPQISIHRGEMFNLNLVAVDQDNNPKTSVIRSYFPQTSTAELGVGQTLQHVTDNCTQVSFRIFTRDDKETVYMYNENDYCRDEGISRQFFNVTFLPCPTGFQLSNTQTSCVCDEQIQSFTNTCDIDTLSVQRKGKFWFEYENTSLVIFPYCPFDYCKAHQQLIVVRLSNFDDQCAFNHSGYLCGGCQGNLSLSLGSSLCQPCQQFTFVWLTLLFALAGVILVGFLLICKLTIAVGTINGLLLYANIAAANKAIFFPSNGTYPLTVFIAWLNLDLGIETCYYDGMDMYSLTWLQFIFPLYVWALVGIIIVVSHYSTTAAKFFGRNPVSVLATLFLFSYTKILKTIITSFSVSFLRYPVTEESVAVWTFDGNIHYLAGKHIPLIVTAVVFLLCLFLPYTLLILCGQWLRRLPRKRGLTWVRSVIFTSVMDAYHAPYKPKYRFWTGLMLLLRCLLFLVFSFNISGEPSVNLLAITIIVLAVLLLKHKIGNVYQSKGLDILELSYLFNLGTLTAGTYHIHLINGTNQSTLGNISMGTAFITFLGTLVYHAYLQVKDSRYWKQYRSRRRRVKLGRNQERNLDTSTGDCTDNYVPAKPVTRTVVELREPLLN